MAGGPPRDGRRRTPQAGVVAVTHGEITADEPAEPFSVVDPLLQPRDSLLQRRRDGFPCQVLFGVEVVIKGPVGETRRRHPGFHALAVDAMFAKAERGGLDDALAGLVLVFLVVTHGSVLRGGDLVKGRVPAAAEGAE